MPGCVLSVGRGSGEAHGDKTDQINSPTFSGAHFDWNCQRRIVFGQNDCDVEHEADVGKGCSGVERKTMVALVVVESVDAFVVKDF